MARRKRPFKGQQFTSDVILWAVRWYLQFPISYRDLELMLRDRGVSVDHTTIYRWIQAYAMELEKRLRPHLRPTNGSWRVDETYIKVKGCWVYLYRAVDSRGQTIDFRLSVKRDAQAAKRFFRKTLVRSNTVNPRTITVDKNVAYPKAVADLKRDKRLWHFSKLRQIKYLNNIVGNCRAIGGQAALASSEVGSTAWNSWPKLEPSLPLKPAQRTWSRRSAPLRDHRICWDLFMRWLTRKLAVPSVIDVPTRKPAR
jgi:IS6 family transposase